MSLSRAAVLARDATITPVKLANLDATLAAGIIALGVVACRIFQYASGGASGTGDDVTIPGLPYKWRIIGFETHTTVGVGASTGNLRTASGGVGTLIAGAATATNNTRNATTTAMNAASVVAANTDIFFRRSDRSVTGFGIIWYVREP